MLVLDKVRYNIYKLHMNILTSCQFSDGIYIITGLSYHEYYLSLLIYTHMHLLFTSGHAVLPDLPHLLLLAIIILAFIHTGPAYSYSVLGHLHMYSSLLVQRSITGILSYVSYTISKIQGTGSLPLLKRSESADH